MRREISKGIIFSGAALSLTVALSPLSFALSPINSTQDGHIIQGGTYYNTAGKETSFINSQSGGLWLKAGTTLRGLEVNSNGALDNNGGTVHLYAPNDVVRVDGNIDVNALRNSQGTYLGNGGKVFIDSAYLFQNGNIFANGVNGGLMQANVGAMTMTPTARIEAQGNSGAGGRVTINSFGPVDIQKSAAIMTTGIPGVDSNVISVTGSLVNNEGNIRADGILSLGPILGSNGGTIQLVSKGNTNLTPVYAALAKTDAFSPESAKDTLQRLHDLACAHNGDIVNQGNIQTVGSNQGNLILAAAGNGGSITLQSANKIVNSTGLIKSEGGKGAGDNATRGGKGGVITLTSSCSFLNNSTISADGGAGGSASVNVGGNGGDIHITGNSVSNGPQGLITANGGSGGQANSEVGGNGGSIELRSMQPSTFSRNDHYILAYGGSGRSPVSLGGIGGNISLTNINNNSNGILQVDGGSGHIGQTGGHISLTNLTNNGSVLADGGYADGEIGARGGNGGVIDANNVANLNPGGGGLIVAEGGDGLGRQSTVPAAVGIGGDGGTIHLTHVYNGFATRIGANGGRGRATSQVELVLGGAGGSIQMAHSTNNGLIQANGGTADSSLDLATALYNWIEEGKSPSQFTLGVGGKGGHIDGNDIHNATDALPVGIIEANGGAASAIAGKGGEGGVVTVSNLFNHAGGAVRALGGSTGLLGGNGGTMKVCHSTNNGDLQVDGGIAGLIGGAGGSMTVNTVTNNGALFARGANTTGVQIGESQGAPVIVSLSGGTGGYLNVSASTNNGLLQTNGGNSFVGGHGGNIDLAGVSNIGRIEAGGGDSDQTLNKGATGGTIHMVHSTNEVDGSQILANGGYGATGGNGGHIIASDSTNNGQLQANGRSSANGGDGGTVEFTNVKNTGTASANGEAGPGLFGSFGTSGFGGTFVMEGGSNSGLIQANSGSAHFTHDAGHIVIGNMTNTGIVEANGGNGDGIVGTAGARGGRIEATNIQNLNGGLIAANGGNGDARDFIEPAAIGFGGHGGDITLHTVTNGSGSTVQANGGDGKGSGLVALAFGGQGGDIRFAHLSNDGMIQANGGAGRARLGDIDILRVLWDLIRNGQLPTLITIGTGGDGGDINSQTTTGLTEINNGTIQANGGGADALATKGGNGGIISISNMINHTGGNIQAQGGATALFGGTGGEVDLFGSTNEGTVGVNGGAATFFGGGGGIMLLNSVNNSGRLSARGGDSTGVLLPVIGTQSWVGGNGGHIIGTNVTNTGSTDVRAGNPTSIHILNFNVTNNNGSVSGF